MNMKFLKDHADAVAIISVNIVVLVILISMCLENSARTDQLYTRWCENQSELKKLHIEFIKVEK